MNAVYEYLFVGLMLIVIFGASVTMVEIIAVPMQDVSDRQELQVTGEKVMMQVLSKGLPVDWGSSPANASPTFFGLAQIEENTRQTFVLDINKVQRLNPGDPYRLDANAVQETLNLERAFGFSLQVTPIYNINVTRLAGGVDNFMVKVFWREDGFPVTNANVSARIFYASVSGSPPMVSYSGTQQLNATTGVDGATPPLDFGIWLTGNPLRVLVVVVDYLGIKGSLIYAASDWQTLPAHQVGEYLLTSSLYQPLSSSQALCEVLAIKDFVSSNPPRYRYDIISVSTLLSDKGVISAPGGGFREYAVTNPEPTASGLFVVRNATGSYYLAYASKEVNFSFGTLSSTVFPPGTRLDRLVTIDDSLYYVRLYLWRLSK